MNTHSNWLWAPLGLDSQDAALKGLLNRTVETKEAISLSMLQCNMHSTPILGLLLKPDFLLMFIEYILTGNNMKSKSRMMALSFY